MWDMDLKPHSSGEFPIMVIQANSALEDQGQVITSPFSTFVGVYNGHGGPEDSRFINFRLFLHLQIGVIDGDMLYVANLGDSRAVLGRKSDGGGLEDSEMEVVAERISTDHNVVAEEVRKEVVELHPVEYFNPNHWLICIGFDRASKKVISREEWEKKLNDVEIRKEDMNKLVMNFLVTEGYVEAAEKFWTESRTERFLEELERTVALLIFEDVTNCPVGELLDISQRLKTSSEVNAVILTIIQSLRHLDRPSRPHPRPFPRPSPQGFLHGLPRRPPLHHRRPSLPPPPPHPDSPDADLSVVVARVLRYSVARDEWSECAPMGTPRFDFACAICDGKIYVAGGRSGGARGTSSAEAYDPATDSWEQLPSMGAARYKCVGVTWRGRFHVVGGFTFEGPFSIERSSAEAYEPWRGAWELVPGMWQLDVPPNQIIGVGDDERLFSSGDCLNTWKGHVEAYDWKMNIWNVVEGSQLREMSSLLEGYGEGDDEAAPKQVYVTMAAIGNALHFLAGYRLVGGGGDHCVSMLHTFDTSAVRDGWRTTELVREEGCNKELCSHCCVVLHVS
ncbi:putative protein phosphatase 2C 78 [Acorus calamus]|uniref:protein-serine/threonine phosphatase n=1 Tax=Acorus calamus TaxID=4465 RepID=A0AAV9DR88_ACOCL|nr:putative protein phosphatase 2C 78 [Acorus calamus]